MWLFPKTKITKILLQPTTTGDVEHPLSHYRNQGFSLVVEVLSYAPLTVYSMCFLNSKVLITQTNTFAINGSSMFFSGFLEFSKTNKNTSFN